jgi:hypothetical protein
LRLPPPVCSFAVTSAHHRPASLQQQHGFLLRASAPSLRWSHHAARRSGAESAQRPFLQSWCCGASPDRRVSHAVVSSSSSGAHGGAIDRRTSTSSFTGISVAWHCRNRSPFLSSLRRPSFAALTQQRHSRLRNFRPSAERARFHAVRTSAAGRLPACLRPPAHFGCGASPGQLRFREELMHELLKELPSESTPRKRGTGRHPAHAMASEHFTTRVDEARDCAVCSRCPVSRTRTHYFCASCQAHLCLGACSAQYHS